MPRRRATSSLEHPAAISSITWRCRSVMTGLPSCSTATMPPTLTTAVRGAYSPDGVTSNATPWGVDTTAPSVPTRPSYACSLHLCSSSDWEYPAGAVLERLQRFAGRAGSGSRKGREAVPVLFADLVGFTTAEQIDPEDVRAGQCHALRARGRGASRRLGLNEARFVPTAVRLGQLVRV